MEIPLDGISEQGFEILSRVGVEKHFEKEELVFREGEPYSGMFLVCSGMFKVYNFNEQGKESLLQTFERGECMALVPVFTTTVEKYHASCSCLNAGTLVYFPKAELLKAIMNDAELAYFMSCKAVERTLTLRKKILQLTLENTEERLYHYLQTLTDSENFARLPLPKNQLALLLAMTPEVLSRSFLSLQNKGKILQAADGYFVNQNEQP